MSACMPSRTLFLRRPFSIFHRGLLTRRTVMFWSRNNKTVAMRAGKKAAQRAQTGKSRIGTSQGRPLVVPKTAGMDKLGRPANLVPCTTRAQRAMRDAVTTPIVGAKLDMVLRIRDGNRDVFRSPFSRVAMVKVEAAHVNVNRALVKVEAGDEKVRPTSDTASKTNMQLISNEKISSVKRVRYLTRLEAEVIEEANKIADVHNPVQE
mmetsp:Transcript_57538/g.153685  ORF Transcript_57538/g.153685 Transcript_57538/m.153685 type:complete len:207 (-) Transcript_57538:613-1233(-)